MNRTTLVFCLLAVSSALTIAAEPVTNIDEESTHQQTRLIEVSRDTDDTMRVNAFCLNDRGELLAACGSGPGEIRILNDQGELLRAWEIAVKPEAINSSSDGTILVGGQGKLFRFTTDGKILTEVDAPHADSLRANTKMIREEAIVQLERSRQARTPVSLESRIKSYEGIIKRLEEKSKKEALREQEQAMIKSLRQTIALWSKQLEEKKAEEAEAAEAEEDANEDGEGKEKVAKKKSGPSEAMINSQVERMIASKMRVASISTDGAAVFVATGALKGYGFAIWKMNPEMTEGKEIVTGLSGCCGQMDVQACENGLFVAENSRKRVVRYDSEGEEICKWGKADRTGVDGFTSCCNPMNVCFNGKGEVFTAESNTGRIKRFTPEGEFLDFVGDVKLVPGCKNVSIAVTPDHEKVYMLDLTRNHIVVMEKKPSPIERMAQEMAELKSEFASVKAELEAVKAAMAKMKKQFDAKKHKKSRNVSRSTDAEV